MLSGVEIKLRLDFGKRAGVRKFIGKVRDTLTIFCSCLTRLFDIAVEWQGRRSTDDMQSPASCDHAKAPLIPAPSQGPVYLVRSRLNLDHHISGVVLGRIHC